MKGTLTLIPTPIDDQSQILEASKSVLLRAFENDDLILVEELKPCRRKWLHFGLPREAIEKFIQYNEHERDKLAPKIIKELRGGKNAYLMSDCGLPAFCDPGVELVDLCHKNEIKVSSTSFSNSVALAVALSGFSHDQFVFEGFITKKTDQRLLELQRILKEKRLSIIMDTPYRLTRLLSELQEAMASIHCTREIFVGMDLNSEHEELQRGSIEKICQKIGDQKREFIILIGPENNKVKK